MKPTLPVSDDPAVHERSVEATLARRKRAGDRLEAWRLEICRTMTREEIEAMVADFLRSLRHGGPK